MKMLQGFTFQTTKSVLAEVGASARIGEVTRSLGCRSVLLVSDSGVVAAGLLKPAIDNLKANDKQEHVGQLAEDAMKQTRLLINNPREVTLADASEIYGAVL